ncbi:TetR/AcrR family transcriptional regulator [Nocardioides cavernae]|uniref:TetR/AcrR family transcriptional regulator n=1 Tax=Nocardioides cavernae TaxID=1921566 RepID=A0ABR8NDD6_9ACTN|nr:TetR/AcrR family transcriptional regulator [Nocardioides cavernae]MBD3924484.1 TetR/AcrR family transcriptional regulator [Nocardioides cavernae]MBM7510570.1 AcrR family transcriptional regulator [Nocardioides cavernae]
MTRYADGHKDATRRRILDAAGRRFKRDGVDASGIAAVMADAGLTNGAFYAHFDSKDELVTHVVTDQVRHQSERAGIDLSAPDGLLAFIDDYLSRDHRDSISSGCPSAALLLDVSRGSASTRRAYGEEVVVMVDAMAALLDAKDPGGRRLAAMSLFASMVGILQLARALPDDLADELLTRGRHDVLRRAEQLLSGRTPHDQSREESS